MTMAESLGLTQDQYDILWDEAWNAKRGPRMGPDGRPGPAVFRSKCDGNQWVVSFYHDGCPIGVERKEGD